MFDDQDVAGPRPTASAWGGGWGGGWGALGSSLTQAVGAAVHDIQELGTSFGQVLQEMADDAEATDEEDDKVRVGKVRVGKGGIRGGGGGGVVRGNVCGCLLQHKLFKP